MATAENIVHPASLSPTVLLMQMINGTQVSQMIGVAAQLDIADHVATEPKSVAELAQATDTHAPSLYRLLRGLAGIGIFVEDEHGRFMLTPLAELLQRGVPGSLHAWARFNTDEAVVRNWNALAYSVRTGAPSFQHLFGVTSWEYLAQHPDLDAIYNAAITELSFADNAAVVAAYDFAGIDRLVELGGGQGTLMATILGRYPALHGVLIDQAHVLPGAQAKLEQVGLADRCELVAGNFFESVPANGDAYLMKAVVHDWDDDHVRAILTNCRRAMPPQGKLLVIESVIPPGNSPHPGKLMDLAMLGAVGGRERTEAEFRTLLGQAEFALVRIIAMPTGQSVIEAMPVS